MTSQAGGPGDRPFPLFDLPRELRDWIYDYIPSKSITLSSKVTTVTTRGDGGDSSNDINDTDMPDLSNAGIAGVPALLALPEDRQQMIHFMLERPRQTAPSLVSRAFRAEYLARVDRQTTLVMVDHKDFQFATYDPTGTRLATSTIAMPNAVGKTFPGGLAATVRNLEIRMFATCSGMCEDTADECDLIRLGEFLKATTPKFPGLKRVVVRIGIWGGGNMSHSHANAGGNGNVNGGVQTGGANTGSGNAAATSAMSTAATTATSANNEEYEDSDEAETETDEQPQRRRVRRQRQPPVWPVTEHGGNLEELLTKASLTTKGEHSKITQIEVYRCEREWYRFERALIPSRLSATWTPSAGWKPVVRERRRRTVIPTETQRGAANEQSTSPDASESDTSTNMFHVATQTDPVSINPMSINAVLSNAPTLTAAMATATTSITSTTAAAGETIQPLNPPPPPAPPTALPTSATTLRPIPELTIDGSEFIVPEWGNRSTAPQLNLIQQVAILRAFRRFIEREVPIAARPRPELVAADTSWHIGGVPLAIWLSMAFPSLGAAAAASAADVVDVVEISSDEDEASGGSEDEASSGNEDSPSTPSPSSSPSSVMIIEATDAAEVAGSAPLVMPGVDSMLLGLPPLATPPSSGFSNDRPTTPGTSSTATPLLMSPWSQASDASSTSAYSLLPSINNMVSSATQTLECFDNGSGSHANSSGTNIFSAPYLNSRPEQSAAAPLENISTRVPPTNSSTGTPGAGSNSVTRIMNAIFSSDSGRAPGTTTGNEPLPHIVNEDNDNEGTLEERLALALASNYVPVPPAAAGSTAIPAPSTPAAAFASASSSSSSSTMNFNNSPPAPNLIDYRSLCPGLDALATQADLRRMMEAENAEMDG